jgi:hypothetical protein
MPPSPQALSPWAPNTTVCIGDMAACSSPSTLSLQALRRWWNVPRLPSPQVSGCGKQECSAAAELEGLRPCSRSNNRQEAFVTSLVQALGVSRGFFLEIGGHGA